ncbi:C-3 sterol dehydrogenase/C-4 decarboxylase family protein [Xylariomycetidae sp. FL0641]|nr:C-3 sterol dehydrogenase/C-4 decarboxylase family protein [Xylariomycetidae sp. FL0641]
MANKTAVPSLSPVLVTGGCGFIGYHVVKGLLEAEPDCVVHVVDIRTDRNQIPKATYHNVDITQPQELKAVVFEVKPKTIFHIACPDSMVIQPSVFQAVNVDGTRNLLAAAKAAGTLQAFVNTSTSSVIHDNVSDLVDASEDLPVLEYPKQKRVYTLTKAVAEGDVLAANRTGGNGDHSMLTTNIRPATAFGERDSICMGKIVATCRSGKAGIQMGPGNNEYDFVYVTSNLVDAQLLAAQALVRAFGKPPPPLESRVDGQSFNVTNDERILFWDFHRAVAASVGIPIKKEDVKVVPVWVGLLMAFISEWSTWLRTRGTKQPPFTREAVRLTGITRTLNGEKAKRVLGYKPRYSIHQGLEIAGKWFVEEAQRQDNLQKAGDEKKSA